MAGLPEHRFTDKDLWGKDGRPGADDVQQQSIGDCYLVSAAGVVAQQTPDLIRNNIEFNEATGEFAVRLYQGDHWQRVPVTQAELTNNLSERGGSSFGSKTPDAGGGLWPAIYEVAYAKMRWNDWETGLQQLAKGGNPADALHAITGEEPIRLDAAQVKEMGMQATVMRINDALAHDKRVVMGTNKDPKGASELWEALVSRTGYKTDGVTGHHAYMVLGARYDEASGEAVITLRNPWGHNRGIDPSLGPGKGAEVEVKLNELLQENTRSFGTFHIGMLEPQQQGLFEAIQRQVGDKAGDAAVALASVQASREGITSTDQLRMAAVTDDGKLWVAGKTEGYRTMVDTLAALPSREESLGQLAQEAQRLQVASSQAPEPPARQLA
ncbi:C2 family cysteine protease [Pseudoxanthomonas sp.]|uniref:C2 family cysteine protease n=1 Tax=Pseudoxanthomonas sp. TaxID=1871049 RepID=UPI00261CFF85|nr:C2 family cysteine protease [Pseudoxanthomonas sp.]WDS37625.1 MAG: C2 family cysteine protease [Pseudoxanthomonas sp.]